MRTPLDEFTKPFTDYLDIALNAIGVDPTMCAKCGKTEKLHHHHKKYDGATLYDIEVLCHSCHSSTKKGLI